MIPTAAGPPSGLPYPAVPRTSVFDTFSVPMTPHQMSVVSQAIDLYRKS